jgi:hypothetical protein
MRDGQPIKRRRTEEERLRRHLYGDKGATFSKAKECYIGGDGIMNCLSTVYSKDNLVCEIVYEI